ncbi:MAG: FHA domain-containing protein [Candidatus Obscuribacter sp.]|nr:FHA domain-containing protein [Candidatus Obscuribacter sp.]
MGRSTSERLSDLKDGGVSNQDRATAIADILTMSPAERLKYKDDQNYRQEVDRNLQETLGKDDDSTKIAQRLLSDTAAGKEPQLTALEKVQVGGLSDAGLPKTIENIENFIQSDPTALERIKNPSNEEDKQLKQTLERELRMAVNRSGEVYYDENGNSNFDSIYKPLADSLFEKNGRVDIGEKLSHTDRDLDAYQALTKLSPQEKAALLNSNPQTEEEKAIQRSVFGRFDSPAEKQLAQEIITTGQFNELNQLRAATITDQSLQPSERDTVKEILGQVKPEDRTAFNDAYAQKYSDNLTDVLNKIPREEQASFQSLLQGTGKTRAEQVEELAQNRREGESGLLGNFDSGVKEVSIQNNQTFLKASETASAKFEDLPLEKQQALFNNASETYAKWQQDKAERANQVTDGVIIGGSLLLTAGASAPVVLSAAAVGGTVKVVGNKALIGDNYGSVEEVTTDFSKGSLNTLLNTLGPAQAASALKLGNNLSREATETIVTKLAQESVELGSNKLLQEGSEQVIQKELNRLIQTSIVDGSDTVSQKAIKQLVSKVATEGNEEVVEKVITTSLTESTEALAKRNIIQKVATEQGLNASSAYVGGVGSGTIEGLSKWDPALSTEENIKRTLQTANDTGVSSAVTAVGFTGILQTGRGIFGKLGDDLQVPTSKAGSDEGNIKAPGENGESKLLRQNPETAILSEARPVVKIDADVEIGLRKYNVNGENFRLQHAGGFFYNRFPSSASEVTDIKVHVTSSSPQDLAKLQEVLIPALQKDPELAKLVPYWKTQDPLYGIGHPEAHGSYPNGQDQGAKAFTLYSKSPADAIAAQKRIDQILSDAKLGLDKPIDSGNVDTIHGASNRVGIVRDHWEITQTSSGLMAAKVDKPLVERIEAQFGNGKLNDSQLRQVEKESGIRANSLEYDRSGNLALKTYASEPHGKGIYLTEAGSDKTVGQLTDRPAMYALARRYDTDPAALAAGKLNLGETPVNPVVAPEIASPVRQEQNALNTGESKPNNYLVLPDGKRIEAGKSELILGRDPSKDVVFGAEDVSRNHAKLKVTADGVKIEDLNSKNGTFVNGERITGEALLKPGDKVRLGQNTEFEFKQTVPANLEYKGKPLSLTKQELTLGRAPDSDLTFVDGTVSREHAKIRKNGDTYSISDLNSRNGTFVNGRRINSETPLKEGDRIRLGNDADELVFRGETEPKLEPVRPRPVMEYQVTGNGSDSVMGVKAQRQSRDLVERFEISEKLEDGFQDIGHNARLRADGQFDDPLRPAIVVDRTQDPVLAKFVEDAKQQFAPLKGDPEALSQALSKHVRENLTPAGWTQEQLTENYLRFSTENANKRILLGEFIEQAKAGKGGGVCNEQSLLLKVLADEFGLDAKIIRGHYGKLPETGLNPNARPNHAWVEITAPGGEAKIYDPRAKIHGVPSENAFNHHPGNGLLRPVETVLAKDAQFGLSEGSPIIHNGQSWKYQGRDKNGDIIITADAKKEMTAADLQRFNPGKNIELGQMYRVPRSNGQIEDDWIVSGINRDNSLVLFKENGLRTTIKADELARENPAIKPVAILSGRDSSLPESYFVSDRAVRLNSGGEGVVYDNLDGTVTKSGSNVDPNEVTMLQALRRAGGNVPEVVSHGYDVNGNYNVRMEKLNGPTLLEWIGSASKGDLEKMREKMSRFFDQISPLYPGDAGGGENWIIVGNEPYAIDVSQGGKNRSMNNTEKREMLELLDWEIARRSMH